MKIVIATAVYYPMINGVAVFAHNLAVGMAQRGHEVLVICPSQTGKATTKVEDGVKVCYLKSADVRVYPDQIHKVPAKRKIKGVSVPRVFYKHGLRVAVFPGREVKRILTEFRPDVVHVQVADPIGVATVARARKMGVPVITTEHNQPEVITDPLKMPKLLKKPANALLTAYFRNRQKKSDFVTMPTRQAINNLLAKCEIRVPVAAVSNGVDLLHFCPGEKAERPTVVYVGRVDPEKKVELVIRAFREVLTKVPEAELLIAGDGVDRARLEELTRELRLTKNVKFLGKVLAAELYRIYQKGWVFATASEIETQGIVLIEAAASGLPLVAVNQGAVAEICRDGQNGFLIDISPRKNESKKQGREREISAISDALKRLLTDDKLREKYGEKSLEIAREHDFERTLERFENIYRKVAKK